MEQIMFVLRFHESLQILTFWGGGGNQQISLLGFSM